MFKLKTAETVTLVSLLLLSGCSSNNPEDEIEPVDNTLPYDSRTVTATIPEEWSQLAVAWGDGSSLSTPFPGEGATSAFGREVDSIERAGLVADAFGEVQYSIGIPYDKYDIHFHIQVLTEDVGKGGEEPALVAASFGGYSSHYAPYYYLADDTYYGLGVSSSMSYEKQYRTVAFLDDNKMLAHDVSYLMGDINSEVEDYADSVVTGLLTSFGLSNCTEVLSGDNLPQGYLMLEDFREMADARLEQESEGTK